MLFPRVSLGPFLETGATISIEVRRDLANQFLEVLFEERYLARLLNVAFAGLSIVG